MHDGAPVPELNVPSGHGRHVIEPAMSMYEPAAHDMQRAAPELMLDCGANVPGAHRAHTDSPVAFVNWPAGQLKQPF